MGRFNTYTSDLKYTPESFDKMAMLPMALRKKHDEVENASELIDTNLYHTKVSSGFQTEAERVKGEIMESTKNLAEKLAKEGVGNTSLMQEFRSVRKKFNAAMSATGTLGQGAKDLKDREEYEKAYTQDATVRAEQGAGAIARNFSEQMKARDEAIAAGYAKDRNFQMSPLEHKYAAKRYEVKDFAIEMDKIIGMSGNITSIEELSDYLVPDGNGGVRIDTDKTGWTNNKEQLKMFADLANRELFNPSSQLNQHLKYNGMDPKDFVSDIGKFIGTMQKDTSEHTNNIQVTGGGKNPNNNTTYKGDFKIEPRTERGQKAVINLGDGEEELTYKNVDSIQNKMSEMERTGDPIITTPEYATQKQMVVDITDARKEWELANADALNAQAKKQGYRSYTSVIDERGWKRNDMEYSLEEALRNSPTPAMKAQVSARYKASLANFDDETKGIKEGIIDKIPESNYLFNQKIFGFALNDTSSEFATDMGKYLNGSRIFIGDQMGKNSFAFEGDGEDRESLTKEELNASNADSIELQSIATKNVKGAPSVGLSLVFGTGEKKVTRQVNLEVKDEPGNIAKEIVLKMLKETSDPKTMYQLRSILDSASANQIIVDSRAETKGGDKEISFTQSNLIKRFNEISPGRNQGVINKKGIYGIISSGSHYELKVKQHGEKDFHIYNVGDFISDQTRGKSDVALQDSKNSMVNELVALLGYDDYEGVKSFNNDNNPILPEDSGSKRIMMANALKKYKQAIPDESTTITRDQRTKAVNDFLLETASVGLKSINKAAFLKN